MFKMNATKAKNEFGLMLEHARKEPVSIERNGRGVAVVISFEEYSRLQELENKYWGDKATKAVANGFMGEKKSAELLSELLNGSED
ncbi:MAG: type II toxin-antitoxin system prevent-host-death family antitoxin [Bdellovibrionota bacterium]